MAGTIEYVNTKKEAVTFGKEPPFILTNVDGLEAVQNEIKTATQYGIEGAIKTGERYGVRDLSIEGVIVAETEDDRLLFRRKLVTLFSRDVAGTIIYRERGKAYSIDVEIEHAPAFREPDQRPDHVPFLINLKALDPYWRDESFYNALIPLSKSESLFEFPLDITDSFEFATMKSGEIVQIRNDGDVDVGCVFYMNFLGEVINPKIYNVLDQSFFGFNGTYTVADGFELSTVAGQKYAYRIKNNNKLNAMHERLMDSRFIVLKQGENYLQVQAKSGVENILVNMQFRPLVIGV